jgi:hypothetical protein
MTDAEIADGWIAEISENDGVVDPNRNMEISFVLDDCIYSDPVRAWSIIKRISQTDMTSWAEANFSAGPLTTFVSRHGICLADQIRLHSREHPRFHDHLLGVVFQDMIREILGGSENSR